MGWIAVIFWLSVLAVFHSYLLYPLLLKFWAKGRGSRNEEYAKGDQMPSVSILLAAYNEEDVIEEKIHSMYKSSFPLDKLEVLVGNDASKDQTAGIVQRLQGQYPSLRLVEFKGRTGKPQIINQLVTRAKGEILILTDANIIFSEDSIWALIKHFRDERVGFVGANILSRELKGEGISLQEDAYVQRETMIKHYQSLIWEIVIAPFGACYALRSSLYTPVPPNYNVDDFFISMNILQQGYKGLQELESPCYEDISSQISEEFRRKARISKGNFQNLQRFYLIALQFWTGLGFSFLSHKVLRWLGPLWIFLAFISNLILALHSPFYQLLFFAQLIVLLLPFLDRLLKGINIHIKLLRFISYFYSMNAALFKGFIQFMKGVNTNVWEPTRRNQ